MIVKYPSNKVVQPTRFGLPTSPHQNRIKKNNSTYPLNCWQQWRRRLRSPGGCLADDRTPFRTTQAVPLPDRLGARYGNTLFPRTGMRLNSFLIRSERNSQTAANLKDLVPWRRRSETVRRPCGSETRVQTFQRTATTIWDDTFDKPVIVPQLYASIRTSVSEKLMKHVYGLWSGRGIKNTKSFQ